MREASASITNGFVRTDMSGSTIEAPSLAVHADATVIRRASVFRRPAHAVGGGANRRSDAWRDGVTRSRTEARRADHGFVASPDRISRTAICYGPFLVL